MRPEESLPRADFEPRRNLRNRQSRSVGRQHRLRRKMRHNAVQQRRLDLEILRDRLNHPVALLQLRQIVFEVARRDQRRQRRLIKRRRLCLRQRAKRRLAPADSRAPSPAGTISSSNDGNARIGQVRGDARAHGSRAQHRGTTNQQRLCSEKRYEQWWPVQSYSCWALPAHAQVDAAHTP